MTDLTRRQFSQLLAGMVVTSPLTGARRQAMRGAGAVDGVVVERDVMVAMRDGVRLACDVHRPAPPASGRFPVILERTPYGKHLPSRTERSLSELDAPKSRDDVAATLVAHGFIVVYQDVRGRYASEGTFRKYVDDAADGTDTCRWILRQPWCNGQIGSKGFSYAAHTQGALASAGAPGVAAMFIDSGAFSNSYQGGIRQGGAFELKQATWAYRNALVSPEVLADPEVKRQLEAVDIHEWFRRMPWRPGHSPLSLAPDYEEYLFELWTRGTFDEYWKRPGLFAEGFYDRFPDVPQVHVSSWFDPYPRTATDNYLGLSRHLTSPLWLIIGPWTHGDRSLSYAGDVDFGPAATWDTNVAPDYADFRLRFFDRWIRGVENGFEAEPRVRIFVMGGGSGRRNADGRMDHGGQWRSTSAWPIPRTEFTRFFLHRDGALLPTPPSDDRASRSYDYDPQHPVPTIGGNITSGAPIMVGGAFDQREAPRFFGSRPPYRPLSERADVLTFETPPLEHDLEVTGPIEAVLWISSDRPDTDFTVKLVDVYPPNADYPEGYAMNVTDGILRVRYRDSWEAPVLMEPGHVYRVTIVPFPTSNRFARGHRLRLDISSSNFPRFDLNFNTGEPEGLATTSFVARNTVHLDRERSSYVLLPIVPAER